MKKWLLTKSVSGRPLLINTESISLITPASTAECGVIDKEFRKNESIIKFNDGTPNAEVSESFDELVKALGD